MTKEQIIQEIYLSSKFNNILKGIIGEGKKSHYDDLKQEVILILLEKEKTLLERLYSNDEIYPYINGIVHNQFRGKKQFSKYWRKFSMDNKFISDYDIDELPENEYIDNVDMFDIKNEEEIIQLMINDINILTNKIEPHKKVIFDMYYKLNEFDRYDGLLRDIDDISKVKSSYRRLASILNISRSSVHKIISEVRKHLKDNLGDKYSELKNLLID